MKIKCFHFQYFLFPDELKETQALVLTVPPNWHASVCHK